MTVRITITYCDEVVQTKDLELQCLQFPENDYIVYDEAFVLMRDFALRHAEATYGRLYDLESVATILDLTDWSSEILNE